MKYKNVSDILYNAPTLIPMKTLIDNDTVSIYCGEDEILEVHPQELLIDLLNWVSLNPEMV